MKRILVLTAITLSLTGCGTWPPQHSPSGLSQQDAQKQYYQCEREAAQQIPQTLFADQDRWMHVARMRNSCLLAQGWHF